MRSTIDWETVVELSLCPRDVIGEMTCLAGRRESGGRVVGVGSRIVIASVATVAVLRQVVALAVADLAIESAVRALQRPDLVVVERRAKPSVSCRTVTGLAVRGESRLLMIGIRRGLVIGEMTAFTVR